MRHICSARLTTRRLEQRAHFVFGGVLLVHRCCSLCANVPIVGIEILGADAMVAAIAEEESEKSVTAIATLDRVVLRFHVMYVSQEVKLS
jgi:hypothetical protein